MKAFCKILASIAIFSFIVGCSSAPKQQVTEGKTLVVGKVVYEAVDIEDFRNLSLNGGGNQKIDLTMKPGGSFGNSLRTGVGGLFFALVDVNEKFSITQVKIKRKDPNNGDSLSVSVDLDVEDVKFTSAKNGVTNVGTIVWDNKGKGGKVFVRVDRKRDHLHNVENYFKERYPDSPWANQPWHKK